MPNGLKIISEEDFVNTDSATGRAWTHRFFVSLEQHAADAVLANEAAHDLLEDKLDKILSNQRLCPGRKYRPVIDKVLVAVMGAIGGFIAVLILAKGKILNSVIPQ